MADDDCEHLDRMLDREALADQRILFPWSSEGSVTEELPA